MFGSPGRAGHGADRAIVEPRPHVGRGQLHPVAGGKCCPPVFRLECRFHPAALAPHRAQLSIEPVDIAVRIGKDKSRRLRVARRVLAPDRHEYRSRFVLALFPGDRAGAIKRAHGGGNGPSARFAPPAAAAI